MNAYHWFWDLLHEQIPPSELRTLLVEKNSENAHQIRVMIDFSGRISNLIVTEIVRLDSLKVKLHHTSNQQLTVFFSPKMLILINFGRFSVSIPDASSFDREVHKRGR